MQTINTPKLVINIEGKPVDVACGKIEIPESDIECTEKVQSSELTFEAFGATTVYMNPMIWRPQYSRHWNRKKRRDFDKLWNLMVQTMKDKMKDGVLTFEKASQ